MLTSDLTPFQFPSRGESCSYLRAKRLADLNPQAAASRAEGREDTNEQHQDGHGEQQCGSA